MFGFEESVICVLLRVKRFEIFSKPHLFRKNFHQNRKIEFLLFRQKDHFVCKVPTSLNFVCFTKVCQHEAFLSANDFF